MFGLILLNITSIIMTGLIYWVQTAEYRRLFIIGAILPLVISAIYFFLNYDINSVHASDIILYLYRGGLVLALFSGAFACFLTSKIKRKR
jgi:hypothetical protein